MDKTNLPNDASAVSTNQSSQPLGSAANHLSLEEVHGTVPVPDRQAGFWAQWRAFVGPASLMAIFMQIISARLGVVTGKDLAQCCREWYPRWARWPQWLLCEIAI